MGRNVETPRPPGVNLSDAETERPSRSTGKGVLSHDVDAGLVYI